MTFRRVSLLIGAVALPLALSGCVAAAIPVIAAGGIAKGEIDKRDTPGTPPPTAASLPPAEIAAAAPVPAETPPPALPALPGPTAPLPGTPPVAAPVAAPFAVEAGGYTDFIRFAAAQAARDPVTSPRNSALLASSASMRPVTQECGILPPAIIIDLDPAGSKLSAAAALGNDPALAAGLAQLRSAEVTVFWASAASAVEAGRIRENLLAAGLDPWGRDPLLLMRRSDDRKELRRRETGKTHCIVAIAGDVRSDFDELFDFLRDPAAAAPLDELIGKGWFLTPPLAATMKEP